MLDLSMPAHRYLPTLWAQNDGDPGGPSHMASLFSAFAAPPTQPLPLAEDVQRSDGLPVGVLDRMSRMTLGDVLVAIETDAADWTPWEHRNVIEAPYGLELGQGACEAFGFDVYQDRATGGTLAAPPDIPLRWEPS